MECPKCGAEITKNTMVCPNCKKVLKIVCPVCKTINTKNVCKKCGKILVTKCSQCGKINLAQNKLCVKCAFPTDKSALINESNADEFAVVRIDFPNSDVVKAKLGSSQLFQKFFKNLDLLILNYLNPNGLRRQIYNNDTYIIRFNKDYTMSTSAATAMKTVIELINIFTKTNVKLLEKKQVGLKCNFTILKRTVQDNPNDISINFRANMLRNDNLKTNKALEMFQVITDETFTEFYRQDYKMDSLDSAIVDGEMTKFYEINLKEFVNSDVFETTKFDQNEGDEVPKFIKNAINKQDELSKDTLNSNIDDDDIYDLDIINFEQINCSFIKTESIEAPSVIEKVLTQIPKGVIALKSADIYQPYSLKILGQINDIGLYDNVIPITCSDEMKYSPYAFFSTLISTVFNYTISQNLINENDYSIFNNIGSSDIVKDLITLTQRPLENIYSIRDKYFEVFLSILQVIPNTLIFIENFEKIDSGSRFALEQIFDHLEELNISWLISYDKTFSLHKTAHFMLSRPYYTEIRLVGSTEETIINENPELYQNILNDFYFQRIKKYACGSPLYIDFATQYLLEAGVYKYQDQSLVVTNQKTIIIPYGLENIVKRRLTLLKEVNPDCINLLLNLVLLGTRIDEKTLRTLGVENWEKSAQTLVQAGYIYVYEDCVYFSNYNILRKCLLELYTQDEIFSTCQVLFDNIFDTNTPNYAKAFLYKCGGANEMLIYEWEKLANINLSMGDIQAYINCTSKILDNLDFGVQFREPEELEKYKENLFENISNNMIEYNSTNKNIADKILQNFQKSGKYENYVSICTKIIQGSIAAGQYQYALKLTHNVLAYLGKFSIDPAAPNFNINLLVMTIIYVKILFNIGSFKECIDIGYNVLSMIDNAKLTLIQNSDIISIQELKYIISECAAYVAISNVITLKDEVKEFLYTTEKLLDFIPSSFAIFAEFQNLIKGEKVSLVPSFTKDSPICASLYYIINAFSKFKNTPENFAKEIYKAKLISKEASLYQFELLSDLLIAYAYIKRNNFKKADSMLNEIITTSKDRGMSAIYYIAQYITSILKIEEKEFDIAYGVLNNSIIALEKSDVWADYLIMLIKINMYKILKNSQSNEQAQICLNQASKIIKKHKLNYNLNIDNTASL